MSIPYILKANKELVKFLSKTLNVAAKHIRIAAGEASRYKKLKIEGDLDLVALGL